MADTSVLPDPANDAEGVDFYQVSDIIETQKINLFIKRGFDFFVSFFSLLFLSVFFVIISIIIRLDSTGPAFYRQTRVGKDGKHFKIIKFRTMVVGADTIGRLITVGSDARITRAGKFLRDTKIDELPQIINVLKGDMSFVGPRPEVPKYVDLYSKSQRQILLVRPGVTDFASIKYSKESELLALSDDPEKTYIEDVMPAKLKDNMQYLSNISVVNDLRIIFATLLKILK